MDRSAALRGSRKLMDLRCWRAAVASLVPLIACREERAPVRQDSLPPAAPLVFESTPAEKGVRYYVDTLGSDSASGSAQAPFRSIQRAAEVAGPGDIVLVRPGRYTGGERIVTLSRSGRPDAWITFRAEQKGRAVVDGKGQSAEAWYFGPGVAYIRVEGFEIRDLAEHAFDSYGGGVHDLVIAFNRVHHIGRNCTDTNNGRTGASLGAATRRVTFDANLWYDIGRLAPGEQGCEPANANYQNHDHGIYVADADEITIVNNVFYRFARGWAVHRYSSHGVTTRGLLIANNTFVQANPYRPGQVIVATTTQDLRIENNIFYAPQSAALYFENYAFPGGVVRNNLVYGGALLVGPPRGLTISGNRIGPDPRFISSSDLRLRPDSPAIDAGVRVPGLGHDAEGMSRPQGRGYDIGAYER
jgi:Right handed beta helix region/Protein of unknown function (DUF1565)